MKDWPGQVVLCVSQIHWTARVHTAIQTGSNGLTEYWEFLNNQLAGIVELVRGELTKQQRITLGALVVIDVHARDVVYELSNKGVASENDFNWLSQLRYYWEAEQVHVSIINAKVRYAYEYLGNTGRLVFEQIWSNFLFHSSKITILFSTKICILYLNFNLIFYWFIHTQSSLHWQFLCSCTQLTSQQIYQCIIFFLTSFFQD